jgi:NAD(P)-dependent dehydrogenase (short-subunit alcohol dehydrogenase family)
VGFALAEQFARRGYDLIVADGYDEIHTAAAALTMLGTDVQAEQVDLRSVDDAYRLHARVIAAGRPVAAAALAPSVHDALCMDGTLDCALELVDSSVRATMLLARLQAERMALQGRGDVILTASPDDQVPGLGTAVYAASAAFLHAFTQMLQGDLGDSGVRVTTVMPEPNGVGRGGFTDMVSELFGRSRSNVPVCVASQAFEALAGHDGRGIAAWATQAVTSVAGRLFPDRVKGPVPYILSPTGEAV